MTKQFSMRNLIAIALMLFSLFFGAGNLIFPPMVGKLAGTGLLPAMLFFAITAVILPVLGMMAVAKTKGLTNLGNRVGNTFSLVFIILVYMSIGPFLAIPRAGSVPFEMAIAPYLPGSFSRPLALAIYTVVFFAFACAISVMNSKSVEKIMGDILTPVLLAMLILLFAASLFKNMPAYGMPIGEYALNPLSKAFIDGYLTMDTLAALNFGLVISVAIEAYGITDEKKALGINIKISLLAGIILFLIYLMLADIGAKSAALFPDTTNGAQILVLVSNYLFGKFGAIILALIFTLACLTTCVGLLASISRYFSTLVPNISYRKWVVLWTLISLLLANKGLNGILKYNIPVLTALYPVSIVLIVLALSEKIVGKSPLMYRCTVYVTAFISAVNALEQFGLTIPFISSLVQKLPLYAAGLSWVIPALIVFAITCCIGKITGEPYEQK